MRSRGGIFAPKMGPTISNRIFVAEAFREPLESLLERSWRPQDLKYRSWERLLAELGPKGEPKWEPKWEPKTVQHAFGSPRGSKRSPGSHMASILDQFVDPLGRQKPHPKGLQTPVCMSVAWHPAALQSSGSARMRWAGHWRACANSIKVPSQQ